MDMLVSDVVDNSRWYVENHIEEAIKDGVLLSDTKLMDAIDELTTALEDSIIEYSSGDETITKSELYNLIDGIIEVYLYGDEAMR